MRACFAYWHKCPDAFKVERCQPSKLLEIDSGPVEIKIAFKFMKIFLEITSSHDHWLISLETTDETCCPFGNRSRLWAGFCHFLYFFPRYIPGFVALLPWFRLRTRGYLELCLDLSKYDTHPGSNLGMVCFASELRRMQRIGATGSFTA
jgi:hypothetical protein